MSSAWKYFFALLLMICATVWLAVVTLPKDQLYLIACDVGQGDAVLAMYGKTQVLIDGGPDNKVVKCLSKYMPFWDRRLEGVILTHPQKDHFGGLIDVLKKYEVQTFVTGPVNSGSPDFELLKNMVGGKGINVVNPTTGMVLEFGLIHLDILHPSKKFLSEKIEGYDTTKNTDMLGAYTINDDPNDFSIVAILNFENFDALLTGDASSEVGDEILSADLVRNVEYIKMPHHGSRNSAYKQFLDNFTPKVAVISVGKNNSYGHPHQEVLNMLRNKDIRVLRTDEEGDVVVVTNGRTWWIK